MIKLDKEARPNYMLCKRHCKCHLNNCQLKIDCNIHRLLYMTLMVTTYQNPDTYTKKRKRKNTRTLKKVMKLQ